MLHRIERCRSDGRERALPYVSFVGKRTMGVSRKRDGIWVRLEGARRASRIPSADVRPETRIARMGVLDVEERPGALQRRSVFRHVRFDFGDSLFRDPMRTYERVALDRLLPDRGIRLAEKTLPVPRDVVHEYLFGRHFGLRLAHRLDRVVYALGPGAECDVMVAQNRKKLDLTPVPL